MLCFSFAACTIPKDSKDTQTASPGALNTFSSEDLEVTVIWDIGEYSGHEVLFATVKDAGITEIPDIATWITVSDEEHAS
ncbi:MAG: hypothetical protein LUE27_03710 [Clostridia bacterium]|nr:hypothetical protein [Clostridia bacterium]